MLIVRAVLFAARVLVLCTRAVNPAPAARRRPHRIMLFGLCLIAPVRQPRPGASGKGLPKERPIPSITSPGP